MCAHLRYLQGYVDTYYVLIPRPPSSKTSFVLFFVTVHTGLRSTNRGVNLSYMA